MRKTFLKSSRLLFFSVGLLFQNCASDELPQPEGCVPGAVTYNLDIKPIIDESCAYNGCHDGNRPDAPGDFQTYDGIFPYLDDGTLRSRVIDLRDDPVQGMPPSRSAYPQVRKEDLTPEEFQLMLCWLNDDFPEN